MNLAPIFTKYEKIDMPTKLKSKQTTVSPHALGFYMPAEWQQHAATWLAWPKNPVTWPDRIPQVEEIFLQMIAALAPHETVKLLVDDAKTEDKVLKRLRARGVNLKNVQMHKIVTADAWIRDYGPIFISKGVGVKREIAYTDWMFNAWGGKYKDLAKDDAVTLKLKSILGLKCFPAPYVLEGGSIDVNGAGTLLTTEQCLLAKTRNPRCSRKNIEKFLSDYLGVRHVIWLGEGIAGDDTDGHVDDVARFVGPRTVLCALEDDERDVNCKILRGNYGRLKHATDQDGKKLEVIPFPMPDEVGGSDGRLPASYANFYIANQVVLVPVFGSKNDKTALAILKELFPKRDVIAIFCEPLVWGLGAIHCLTQQEPAT